MQLQQRLCADTEVLCDVAHAYQIHSCLQGRSHSSLAVPNPLSVPTYSQQLTSQLMSDSYCLSNTARPEHITLPVQSIGHAQCTRWMHAATALTIERTAVPLPTHA